ncbi:hypothetical protein Dcar01_03537 [Deinococcus carri]|uniref:Phage major capsid protein n=1 Tax=Deinococcus carri TaxID=1211323 RepID=A0ABP9WCN7_9DEIO
MSKTLRLQMQLAEARGEIPAGTAQAAADSIVVETGIRAFYRGYHGPANVDAAFTAAQQQHAQLTDAQVEAQAENLADELRDALAPLMAAQRLTDTHTTSDLPLALANLRQRTLLPAYQGPVSNWRTALSPDIITVPDFKTIRTLRLSEMGELAPRAEGEDVTYTTFSEAEGGYRVGNFERAVAYTWEMDKNDEVGAFARALESLGRGAARTEVMVIFKAIKDGLASGKITGATDGSGAPSIDTLKKLRTKFAGRTFKDGDGNDLEYGFDVTDIVFGTSQRDVFNLANTQEYEDARQGRTPNILRGAFNLHLERLWSRVFGQDYVAFDSMVQWLQVAFLEGFQGGPLTYTEMPTSREYQDQGSFRNHTFGVKVGHTLGARVIDPNGAVLVQGS